MSLWGPFLQSRVERSGRRGRQGDRRGPQGQHLDHQHQVSPYAPCLYLIMGGGHGSILRNYHDYGPSSFLLQPRGQRPGPARQRRDQVRLGRPRRQPPALKSWPPPRILYFAPRPIKFPSQITVHRSICRFIGVWQQESQSQRPQRDSNTGQSPQLCPGFSRRRLAPPDHPTPGAPAPVVAASQYSL